MANKVFIDGEHGTTGLQIRERLAGRTDLEMLSLAHEDRRDEDARAALLREADIAILCLPDDAAKQSVAMIGESGTRVIDASTAHRTDADWVFGFAELEPGHGKKIAAAKLVSNPGCYSTGAIALINPLVKAGLLAPDYPVTLNAVSGYSGGGKGLIAQMEEEGDDAISSNFFAYATPLTHKHVPEIITHCGLSRRPIFTPSVGRFAQGMQVNLPLHLDLLSGTPDRARIHETLVAHYDGCTFVRVASLSEDDEVVRLDAQTLVDTDTLDIHVFGDADTGHVNLIAVLDNLGKGASGAAVQNLDLMIGN